MAPPRTPDGAGLTLDRLAALLDAYGAAPERWPEAERKAAQELLERSAAARALARDAVALDRLLDAVPAAPPSAGLALRVLAAAPRPSAARAWWRAVAAAVPLAAAAAVVLWMTMRHEPDRLLTSTRSLAVGEYTSPTDVLLAPYGVDVYATVPAFGCSDSVLGCPNVDTRKAPYSQGRLPGGFLA